MTEPFKYRDENGGLRLDEILGEAHAAHYIKILTSSSAEFRDMQERVYMLRQDILDRAERTEEAPWRAERTDEPRAPRLTRMGGSLPVLASSCREVTPSPSVCWDVRGYYRRLGVHWRASNKELRLAYLALDPRNEDEPLHYALTQLLDPQVRRLYDQMGPAEAFLLDRDVNAMIKRAAARESSRRMRAHQDNGSVNDVMREWGFYVTTPAEARADMQAAREQLAAMSRADQAPADTAGTSLLLSRANRREPGWEDRWGYYALLSPDRDMELWPGPGELEAWQAMIAAALSQRGISMMFAVGAHESESPMVLLDGNKACIFITGKGASPEKADEAIAMGISQGKIGCRHR